MSIFLHQKTIPQLPEAPIRAELFSVERLEQHAESLAKAQQVATKVKPGRQLDARLYDNTRVLTKTHRAIATANSNHQTISPAAEWLFENFHIVDEQIRDIKNDLPPGYYRLLPKLAAGPLREYPRIFGIAWALVAHTDSAFDSQRLIRFLEAYQRTQPLTIGELWALPITLRITLVENLRRLAGSIMSQLLARQLADTIANKMRQIDRSDPASTSSILSSLDQAPWSTAFAAALAQILRSHDPNATPELQWLNERLGKDGSNIDQIVRQDVQSQGAIDVTVRNVITSMRLISTINWAELVESISPVDAILRQESNFAQMDFTTRDLYRRAIEELARQCDHDESHIAKSALAAARGARSKPADVNIGSRREADPGYYLIARGRPNLEKELGCRVPLKTRLFRLNADFGVTGYVMIIAFVTALVLITALAVLEFVGAGGWAIATLAVIGLIPASDVGVSVVNRAIASQLGGLPLPGLELRDGIPRDLRTIIVMPTLLADKAEIKRHIERLEVHHLSSSDDNFLFALLSDWRDSATESEESDDALLNEAVSGIAQLNVRYGLTTSGPRFYLLHRRRIWNEGEQAWIGWERKRGKLHELNRLLRGAKDTTFVAIHSQATMMPTDIRYVITLDADTRLPIGAAKRLVGKMAHPLNQPNVDHHAGLVVMGHGILQPRVTPSLPVGTEGSLFQRVFSGPNGLDPYALTVSDVYQDLFEQGSYCGKGIYEVDTFEEVLGGRIPESAVLSHDLLEGIFARAGLASDIEVVEEFPSRYAVSAARQHRWVRGDWQLLPWIFNFRQKSVDGSAKMSMPLIGRWKLLDNLRRSLTAPATLLALLVGWFQPIQVAMSWSSFVLLTIALPPLLPAIAGVVPHRASVTLRNHMRALRNDLVLGLLQSAFLITFLAHQSWNMIDAVGRTLARLFVRSRHLLEWTTAAQSSEDNSFDHRRLVLQMAASVGCAGAVSVALYLLGEPIWPFAAPLIGLWGFSPLVAHWASQAPLMADHIPIAPPDALTLRMVARRTWRYFETFVTEEDNMLPPDNFQEDPRPVVAHRTSPTNIGLYLLSIIAARDLGWLGTLDALERLEATLGTMLKLERFRGHFYNWYDTCNLKVLEPKYISSVDSGNLAGHLIVVSSFCREILNSPVVNQNWISGLQDTLALVREAAILPKASTQTLNFGWTNLHGAIDAVEAVLNAPPGLPSETVTRLNDLVPLADAVVTCASSYSSECAGSLAFDILFWADALRKAVGSHLHDVKGAFLKTGIASPETLPGCEIGGFSRLTPSSGLLPNDPPTTEKPLAPHDDNQAAATAMPGEKALAYSGEAARPLAERLGAIADLAATMLHAMQFHFLYDADRQLLSIGYRGGDGTLDANFYDLLASEARLASFVAIAKGDLPAKHWFRLGRTLTPIDGGACLISWSGSMFEYLMPSLVMRAPAGSLLAQTNRLAVWRQERYGKKRGVPWGISESEYNARDADQIYQYSGFGVPDLGFKQGLADDLVIAPYATGLACMVSPSAAVQNFKRLADIGACGAYGCYDALDYTLRRRPDGAKVVIIRAYMAHHQAMIVVGIANALQDGRIRARFHADPIVRAAELLLQERMPRDVVVARTALEQAGSVGYDAGAASDARRRYVSAHSRSPRTQLLSNGRYTVMLTAAGSGYSQWRDIAINRWREDVTRDGRGTYFFLRDLRSKKTWSAGYHPSAVEPDSYSATFSEDCVEIERRDGDISTILEVIVSPEDDAEVRRVSITNAGKQPKDIEITSYVEIALARQLDDMAHPAFASLFIQTEFIKELDVILATRRQRSVSDPLLWVAHLAVVEGEGTGDVQYETDRARFLGRGQTTRTPTAIADGWPLSNTAGTVLDPILSLRRHVRIAPGATARIAFWTMVAGSREAVLDMADKHHDPMAFERAKTLAWTQAQMQLHHLSIEPKEADLFQRLASHILYSNSAFRPAAEVIKHGLAKVSALWPQGISGDFPIVLVRVDDDNHIDLVRQLLRAHEYWRAKLLAVDLVIVNERAASYAQDFQGMIDSLVRINRSIPGIEGGNARGKVVVARADLVPDATLDLLAACARVVLDGKHGALADQMRRTDDLDTSRTPPVRRLVPSLASEPEIPVPKMEFWNGLGGFIEEGAEYLTILGGSDRTPAPWVNVIANPSFGFQVSTDGSGFTWSVNSQQNQMTAWSNDPVCDPTGEAIYVRDEDSGDLWSPTALPIRETHAPYAVRHGQGYSRFDHISHGISLELTQFVPTADSIKISRLKITNLSRRVRHLSITAYVEWVLGTSRSATAPFILTEIDPESGALLARNPWNDQFGGRVAFADLGGLQTSWTGDRTEFLGRDGAMDRPLALSPGKVLSNRVGAGLDPCAAMQTAVRLDAGGSMEVDFYLGQSAGAAEAVALVMKYRTIDLDSVLMTAKRQWNSCLEAVQVKTPDRALDILLNRWLPYQTLGCRVWARSAFYQASGAYGFRDQLQDVMALCISRPDIAREHLLRASSRQFSEGDVQHWWLQESGRGVRTRVSDDQVWLPYVVSHYVDVTGDRGVLDEMIPFLEGRILTPGESDEFSAPKKTSRSASLFEHCALALDKSLAVGTHGLPLIGGGDWNDGMNAVGSGGKGESVWLAWFLHTTLRAFADLAQSRDQSSRVSTWRQHADSLRQSLDRDAWDGDWYRRAFFDDGSPLGSVENSECRIDSIAQSWAVISGAADPARSVRAMAALDKYLINRDAKLSLLFTPPFNFPARDPGYIKGYPPGIRENGGQYTHGAVWAVLAYAMLHDGDKAGELLSMLNPIRHSDSPAAMQRYKVEPYVICADLYSEPPHVGRGGWTWYTGSAGWLYRVALESILGFHLHGATLELAPCIPRNWRSFEIIFQYRSARYEIVVQNPDGLCQGTCSITLDGQSLVGNKSAQIPLTDDGRTHHVRAILQTHEI